MPRGLGSRVLRSLAVAIACGLGASAADAACVWADPAGGMTFALLIAPTARDTVYAGTSSGGVFRSTDGGRTWTGRDPSAGEGAVVALAAANDAPAATLYAATRGDGVFTSRDGGETWSAASGLGSPLVSALVATAHAVYAGTDRGLFRSTDDGRTWSEIPALAAVPVLALASAPDAVYAGTDRGLFRSADGGASWTALRPGRPGRTEPLRLVELAVDGARPGVLLAATADHVLKTEDGGESWRTLLQVPFVKSITVGAGTTYLGTSYRSVLTSTDGGVTWSEPGAGFPPYAEVLALAFDPRTRITYAGTSHPGVLRTADGGRTWRHDEGCPREVTAASGDAAPTDARGRR